MVSNKKIDRKNYEIYRAILERLAKGKKIKEIANELQMPENEISNRIRQMRKLGINIPSNLKKKTKNDEIDDQILELLREGKSKKEIADILFFASSTIKKRIERMRARGVAIPKGTRRKRTTDEIDQRILSGLAEGKTQREIARELGISSGSVSSRKSDMKKRGIEIPHVKRRYEKDEIDDIILSGLAEGKAQTEIARELGISRSNVYTRVRRMRDEGISIPHVQKERKTKNDDIDDRILEELRNGKNPDEIITELNLSKTSFYRRIREMRDRGIEITITSTNTDERVETYNIILERLSAGKSRKEIAEELGISKSTLNKRISEMKERGLIIQNQAENDEIDNAIISGIKARKTQTEIALELGVAKSTVHKRIKKMQERGIDIPDNSQQAQRDEIDNYIIQAIAQGKSEAQIGRELGVKKAAICGRIKRMKERGLATQLDLAKKERSNETDDRILEEIAEGKTHKEIARKLGISKSGVTYRIKIMRKRGIEIPKVSRKRTENDEIDSLILAGIKAGKTKKRIANELHMPEHIIYYRVKSMRKRGIKIPRVSRSREHDEIDNAILAGIKAGKTQKEIANEIGFSTHSIYERVRKMRESGVEIPEYSKAKKENDEFDRLILRRLAEGKKQSEIARELNFNPSTIFVRIRKMRERGIEIPGAPNKRAKKGKTSIESKKRKTENDELDNAILERLVEGNNLKTIAEELGISDSTVSRRIKDMQSRGIEIPNNTRKKTENDEIDNAILAGIMAGKSQKEIARELGMSKSAISYRVTRMRERGTDFKEKTMPEIIQPLEQPQQQPPQQSQTQQSQHSKEEIKRAILKLSETRNASKEQLKILADQYGVDISTELDFMDVEQDEGPEL